MTPSINSTLTPIQETLDELEAQLEMISEYLESDDKSDRTIAEQLFEQLLPSLERKIDSYTATIRRKQAQADFRRAEAHRIHKLAATDEKTVNWLKDKLLTFMNNRVETLGSERGRKLEGIFCKISLCTNGGKPPVWINPDLAAVEFPREYVEYVPTVDTEKLTQMAIASGEVYDESGRLIAKVTTRGKHVRIS